jgi:cysteine synthase
VKLDQLDDIIAVDGGDAICMTQALARELGLAVGMSSVNTYCRRATGARTFCSTHLPYRSTRFCWQLGQK